MHKLFLSAVMTGLMLASVNSHAVTSRCDAGPGYDGFYHRASLDYFELGFPWVRTWMETHVNGPVSPGLYSYFYNTWNSWHFFIDMPPGHYAWYGFSQTEIDNPDYYWGILGLDLCAASMIIEPPPYCETTDIQVTGSSTLTSAIHGYLVSAIQGGFEAVEKLGACSITGVPTFSGSLKLEEVTQCCEATDSHDNATRATGRATFSVPSLNCSVKQIIVPTYGIVLEGSVGAGASASFAYSGMDEAMCDVTTESITLSGTVGGGFSGEMGVGGIDTSIIGAGVRLSDSFTLSASGPDVLTLDIEGCIGPAEITGWFRFLGSEFKTEIVPREWAEGTRLCF